MLSPQHSCDQQYAKLALFRKNIISPEKISKLLEGESINIILRKNRKGQLYRIITFYHITRFIVNGSLGKEFNSKRIQENFPINILEIEKKNQKPISTSAKNFQYL